MLALLLVKNTQSAWDIAERAAQDTRSQLGLRLKALRKDKHLPITGLAKLTGVAPNTIRAIERGLPCRRISLQRIVDTLNRPIEKNGNGNGNSKMPERPLLNEDLDIASLYHDAPTMLRNFIAQLLRARDYAADFQGPDPALLALASELSKLTESQLHTFRVLLSHYQEVNATVQSASSTDSRRQKKSDKRK